ncbi:MAG: hypothetical protein A2784_04140 [Candidatus Chisholmbacteria bacterium RIFCSPHIGHO2_01_FULL_48_12]|uniref:Acetyl-CoA acetyltransferase n=1 Tax=Candidatus Chisholmbacteria bacterium RIFCSPHIGHO2_01_FULL_48_12 TaxID=1797589 RepID=A0A1G1VNM4_9BACT|nr:MAG: hypothetical protein A2784_04140 [Candidatus Chisholmbacteria bacterium RIFCSPHIGHO2_01_FULL_48_12]
MKPIYILGTGHTPFGKSTASIAELMGQAVTGCLEEAQVSYANCELAIIGNFSAQFVHQSHLGPVLNTQMNGNIEAIRVEAACAAGAVAFRQAVLALLSGIYTKVLVVGVEKMTQVSSQLANEILISSAAPQEQQYGNTFAGQFALIARAYLDRYPNTTYKDLARIAVINHRHALTNPLAQFHKPITLADVLTSPVIAHPLRLFDCAPLSDGAAAILLSTTPPSSHQNAVAVAGLGFATGGISLSQRQHLDQFPAARQAAKAAYSQAGITPSQVDLAEIHDAFTISELILLEELGFAAAGQAYKLIRRGAIGAKGTIPVNLSGGLKAKGHPVGATGVSQIVSIARELQTHTSRQIGLTCNLGGVASTAAVTILRRKSL